MFSCRGDRQSNCGERTSSGSSRKSVEKLSWLFVDMVIKSARPTVRPSIVLGGAVVEKLEHTWRDCIDQRGQRVAVSTSGLSRRGDEWASLLRLGSVVLRCGRYIMVERREAKEEGVLFIGGSSVGLASKMGEAYDTSQGRVGLWLRALKNAGGE